MITAGIDCGAKNIKTVIMRDGRIVGKGAVLTGFDLGKAIAASLAAALQAAGIGRGDVQKVGGTGAGKKAIPDLDSEVNDIKAIARAAHYFFPNARTVVDVGAEKSLVVKVDAQGGVVDFATNEKCAAGAGAFIEAMGRALEVKLEDMGRLALQSDKVIPMNAQCAIFAESEVVGLIHAKTELSDISKSIHDAMASRIVSMIRKVGLSGDVAVIGGVGRNPGFVAALQRELQLETLFVPQEPEFGAAVGAALEAAEEI